MTFIFPDDKLDVRVPPTENDMRTELKWTIVEWLEKEERSQAYLARKANMSEEHLSRIMNGHCEPKESTEEKIMSVIK